MKKKLLLLIFATFALTLHATQVIDLNTGQIVNNVKPLAPEKTVEKCENGLIAAAQDKEYKTGHFYYKICTNTNEWISTDGQYAELTRISPEDLCYTNEDVIVPSKIEIEGSTYDVRAVNMNSFNWMSKGQKLRLPSSIRDIFRDIKPNENIDESLFPNITITFPSDSIEYIGAYGLANTHPAYLSSNSFTSLKAIETNAFNNSGFKGIYIGKYLQFVASDAFHHGSPSYISFSNNKGCAKTFSSHSFNECNITELAFPEANVLTIEESAVTQCPALECVYFPALASISMDNIINNGQPIYMLSDNPSLKEIICKGNNPPEIILPGNNIRLNFHITDNEDMCILKVPEGYEQAYRDHPIWGKFNTIVPYEETMSLKHVDNYVYRITKSASNFYSFDTAQAELIGNDFNEEYPSEEIIIPNQITVNSISYPVGGVRLEAFSWIKKYQKLTLPSSVKVISNYNLMPFEGAIEFPESVESLEGDLFADATIKTDLYLPKIKHITWRVFNNSNVEKIILGASLSLIGSYAFGYSSLKEITFEEGEQNTLQLSSSSFSAVNNIKELKIPKRNKLSISDGFVSSCDNLERVVFPDVNEIDCTSSACHDLAMIRRPCGILIVNCPNFKDVVCLGSVPPEIIGIDDNATYEYDNHTGFWITDNMDRCILKVPAGSEQAYRNDPIWGKFKTILGFENGDYTSISSISGADNNLAEPIYYNLQGIRVSHPVKGQSYIRVTGSKIEKVIM